MITGELKSQVDKIWEAECVATNLNVTNVPHNQPIVDTVSHVAVNTA